MVLSQLSEEELVPQLRIDAAVDLSEVSEGLYAQLKKLEPCGMGNPQPVFVSRGVEVLECRVIGKEAKHLKLRLTQASSAQRPASSNDQSWQPRNLATSQPSIDAVAFGFGDMAAKLQRGILVDVVFTLEENVWNGRVSLQLKVKDLRLAEN